MAQLFHDLGTRWGWVVSVTPRPPLHSVKTRDSLCRRLDGPQGRYGQVRKISPPPGFDPRTDCKWISPILNMKHCRLHGDLCQGPIRDNYNTYYNRKYCTYIHCDFHADLYPTADWCIGNFRSPCIKH